MNDNTDKLLDKISSQFIHQNNDLLVINQDEKNIIIDDIAVIECFYGCDRARILATTRAINKLLSDRFLPKEIVFVEAQMSEKNKCFGWLEEYGVKYIFKIIPPESDGLLLKTSLWNIAAKNCVSNNLCFIDSDVVFSSKDWLNSVSKAFSKYDILSLGGHSQYEDNPDRIGSSPSIGYSIMTSNGKKFDGHIGFTIGMKRDAYNKYGRFEAFNLHDDAWIWTRIVGTTNRKYVDGWFPYVPTENMKYGLPFEVGSTDEVCIHLDHGYKFDRYELFGLVSSRICKKPFDDIVYDRKDVEKLPTWKDNLTGSMVKRSFQIIRNLDHDKLDSKDFSRLSNEIIVKSKIDSILGKQSEKENIIIYTGFTSDFKHKNIESIVDFRKKLLNIVEQDFIFICFTDEISSKEAFERYDLNVIPFSSKKASNNRSIWEKEIFRDDIQIPEKSFKIYLDSTIDI